MDILDILIAKKKSFTGETEKLVRQANEAMAKANEVAKKIDDAEEALSAAQDAQEAAEAANTRAQEIASDLESMKEEVTSAASEVIDEKLATATAGLQSAIDEAVTEVTVEDDNNSSYKSKNAKVRKKGLLSSFKIMKNYTTTGSNEDGSMTQKAITTALNTQKTELENKIRNIPSNGGNNSENLIDAAPGSVVIVGEDGSLNPSTITENDLIKTQILLGSYIPKSTIGVEIDYDNKTVRREQEAINLNAGPDFDKYFMYGGRKRCLVNNNGEILAFAGEEGYIEDGSLGQIMVYQPKFYYIRTPLKTTKAENRIIINKELIYISDIKQPGFTIHPLFLDENDNELDYILLSAYEGSAFDVSNNSYNLIDNQDVDFTNDLLSSIINARPISGTTQSLNITNISKLAKNRGIGWNLTNLMAESVNQILMIIEFATLNIQSAFNAGITQITNVSNVNTSCFTGSTTNLNSTTGVATSSSNYNNTYNEEGKCAISYRGVENPYGNIWHFVEDVKIIKQGNTQFLVYKDNHNIEKTYASAIPSSSDWISYFGYDENAPWAFIPTICKNANSAVPVGDYTYINNSTNENKCCVIGGKSSSGEYAGPFYYGMDYNYNTSGYSYGGRLMYRPTINTEIYFANINKWREEVGGE